ncbi:hypothetical protein [Neobacillus vireti]|uniref:hypothetical protein n=1 Tax=Neobacillus vireti TaxID=220686 RepID=UPI00300072F9
MKTYALPNYFDLNETIILLFWFVLFYFYIKLPKQFPASLTVFILVFGAFSARLGDILFFPYDLYDVMDNPKHCIFDLILYTLIYPLYVYFYCYFYDRFKLSTEFQFLHIICWAILSFIFEWLGSKAGIYTYKGWRPIYSFNIYLLLISWYTLMLYKAKSLHKSAAP